MPNHDHIYQNEAEKYELLISREDYEQNVMKTITRLLPNSEFLDAVDIGAGTGKLARLLAPRVKSIIASDASRAMLDVAAEILKRTGTTNWKTCLADNRSLPLPDHSVDVVTAGWTICYSASTNADRWKENLEIIMTEIERVLRPAGTVIIMETFGTGVEQPQPPDFLLSYYAQLKALYGFSHEYIRTDFKFESVDEAEDLSRFFFGNSLADKVRKERLQIVPGCTGVWWKTMK